MNEEWCEGCTPDDCPGGCRRRQAEIDAGDVEPVPIDPEDVEPAPIDPEDGLVAVYIRDVTGCDV